MLAAPKFVRLWMREIVICKDKCMLRLLKWFYKWSGEHCVLMGIMSMVLVRLGIMWATIHFEKCFINKCVPFCCLWFSKCPEINSFSWALQREKIIELACFLKSNANCFWIVWNLAQDWPLHAAKTWFNISWCHPCLCAKSCSHWSYDCWRTSFDHTEWLDGQWLTGNATCVLLLNSDEIMCCKGLSRPTECKTNEKQAFQRTPSVSSKWEIKESRNHMCFSSTEFHVISHLGKTQ